MTRTVCSLLTQGHIGLDPVTEHMGSQTITPPFPVFTSCCLGTNPSPSRAYLLTWGLLLYCLKQVWLYHIVTMPFRKEYCRSTVCEKCFSNWHWIDLWERGNNRNLFCFYTSQKIKFKMSQSWRRKIFAALFKFHLISCIHWELHRNSPPYWERRPLDLPFFMYPIHPANWITISHWYMIRERMW